MVFQPAADNGHTLEGWQVAQAVMNRARSTDAVGWVNHYSVCALLPDTSATGARCFVNAVCEVLETKGRRPMCTVFTYPSSNLADGEVMEAWQASSGRNGKAARQQDGASVSAGASTTAVAESRLSRFTDEVLPQRPLESLLIRPLPAWKRAIDILAASMGLLVLSPIMILCALAIRLGSSGPVFFKQKRSGLGGVPFMIYKFRTMVTDAEARKQDLRKFSEQDGPAFKMAHDPRITRVGRFLRTTSLDELPQLINVLKGDMTLVGPRPLPCAEQAGCSRWQHRRLEVTPGLTCIWQVHGRSQVTFNEWMRMDMRYIHQRAFLHDLKLLLETIPAVLFRKGAR